MAQVKPYEHQEFPKVVYGRGGDKKVVSSKADLEALGDGYKDSPADFKPNSLKKKD